MLATMIVHCTLTVFALVILVSAINLHVASYAGQVTTLSLNQAISGEYALSILSAVDSISPQPSWLEKVGGMVFLASENFAGPNGSLVPFMRTDTGELRAVQSAVDTPPGPVSIIAYNQGKALAVAHYGGSAVSNYAVSSDGSLKSLQSFFFKTPPGPRPQQDASHPHQVILDPSEKFIIVPDLGSDLLRIFSIGETSQLTEQKPFSVPAGSGPRHGGFLKSDQASSQKTFFFLVSELGNTVASYSVTNAGKSLDFTPISTNDILNQATPPGLASAELVLSPDKRFVHTSARNATIFSVPNFSAPNKTSIPSDAISTWRIDSNSGVLSFRQLTPAGGRTPRHFSLNKDGSMAAVALQGDGRVVIFERNTDNGNFGNVLASTDVKGQLTCVIWDE